MYKADTGKSVFKDEIYLKFKRNSKGELMLNQESSSVRIHWSVDEPEIFIENHTEEYVKWLEEKIDELSTDGNT
jgi:hypothetical protein